MKVLDDGLDLQSSGNLYTSPAHCDFKLQTKNEKDMALILIVDTSIYLILVKRFLFITVIILVMSSCFYVFELLLCKFLVFWMIELLICRGALGDLSSKGLVKLNVLI